ncbi:MAG: hypothetical protein QXR81_08910 [Candidatus Nezhaarchaeales archaeon]
MSRVGEELELRPLAKKAKQLIWLDASTLAKVYEVASKTGRAANVVCAEAVKRFFEGGKPFLVEREKVVEKVVERPRAYLCPGCDELFNGVEEVKRHLKAKPECLQRMRGMVSR